MRATPQPNLLVLVAVVAIGCASSQTAVPEPDLSSYRRLYLTTPSHSAGFAVEATPSRFVSRGSSEGYGSSEISARTAVQRAYDALRFELIDAGFDVVALDSEADAVLELTMNGIGDHGDAERAFVVFRDSDTGRILVVIRAHARDEARSVEEIMARIVGQIEESFTVLPAGG